MQVFIIDDEAPARNSMERMIREVRPKAEIRAFSRGKAALDAVVNEGLRPDVVFSDIQMPGLSGLDLAVRLRTACPSARVIFVTGYNDYAVDAYRLHAYGYVMKPLNADRVREELEHLEQLTALISKPELLTVRCFGYFDVFWKGKPLHFSRQQAKELFAYLVSREGSVCTSGEISAALWETEGDRKVTANRIRTLLSGLRATFRDIGMEDVLIRHRASIAVNPARIDCDFYRMKAGDMDALNSYNGEFMLQYSWAEQTAGMLAFYA